MTEICTASNGQLILINVNTNISNGKINSKNSQIKINSTKSQSLSCGLSHNIMRNGDPWALNTDNYFLPQTFLQNLKEHFIPHLNFFMIFFII